VNIIRHATPAADARIAVRRELASLLEQRRLDLPAMPEHASRALALAARPVADARALARLIASDQPLAARVMKVARAAAYQPSSPIGSLGQAIAWLGAGEVADIVFSASIQRTLLGAAAPRPRVLRQWQASVACAIWSEEVAGMARRHRGIGYLCGLMHDAGKLVAQLASTDLAGKLGVLLSEDDYDALTGEFHQPLGLLLVQQWNLPEVVAACIRGWQDPQLAGEFADDARVVHIAHHVAEMVIGQGVEIARETLPRNAAIDQLHIGPDRIKALIDRSGWVMGQVRAY
jgi:HD-like signal output (HDOD) protein